MSERAPAGKQLRSFRGKLRGKKVVFVGGNIFARQITEAGGKVQNNVTKDTDYVLLYGRGNRNSRSKKILDAKKYGIRIIPERDFFRKFHMIKKYK